MARSAWLLVSLLALPLALAWGCSSSVNGTDDGDGGDCGDPPPPQMESDCPPAWQCIGGQWVDTAGDCPDPECPQSEPTTSTACSQNGQQCSYWHEDEPCGEAQGFVDYECIDHGWSRIGTRCSEPPECPGSLPEAGELCFEYPQAVCPFTVQTDCGETSALASCISDADGWWWQVSVAEGCTCQLQDNPTACEQNGCRWLVPGCGDVPLAQEGCYPATDCTADSCGDAATCTEVTIDPCWNEPCDACSAPAAVCEPLVGSEEEGT